jgi:hypothetical protein
VARDDGFGRSSRFYETPDGNSYPSVTTILQAVNKPALVNWAAKVEREAVIQAAANLWEDAPTTGAKMTRPVYVTTLEARIGKQKAHQKALAKAGEIGSQVHALIEWNLRKQLGQKVGPEPEIVDGAAWAFAGYEEWRSQAGFQPKLIEQAVWSNTYGYAGTMDWFGSVNGVECVGDWKTGKAIYGEAVLQNAAYVHALKEMGHVEGPVGGCIVRLPKVEDDPGIEVKIITPEELDAAFAVFLNVFEVWKWMDAENAAYRNKTAAA